MPRKPVTALVAAILWIASSSTNASGGTHVSRPAPSPTPSESLADTIQWLSSFVSKETSEYTSELTIGGSADHDAVSVLEGDADNCTLTLTEKWNSRRSWTSTADDGGHESRSEKQHRVTSYVIPLADLDMARTSVRPATGCLSRAGWTVVISSRQPTITYDLSTEIDEDCTVIFPSWSAPKTCSSRYPGTRTLPARHEARSTVEVGRCVRDQFTAERVKNALDHAAALCAGFKPKIPAGSPF